MRLTCDLRRYEYERTIQTLWPTVREFAKLHPEHIAPNNALGFMVDDLSEGLEGRYNLCQSVSSPKLGCCSSGLLTHLSSVASGRTLRSPTFASGGHRRTRTCVTVRAGPALELTLGSTVLQLPRQHRRCT